MSEEDFIEGVLAVGPAADGWVEMQLNRAGAGDDE